MGGLRCAFQCEEHERELERVPTAIVGDVELLDRDLLTPAATAGVLAVDALEPIARFAVRKAPAALDRRATSRCRLRSARARRATSRAPARSCPRTVRGRRASSRAARRCARSTFGSRQTSVGALRPARRQAPPRAPSCRARGRRTRARLPRLVTPSWALRTREAPRSRRSARGRATRGGRRRGRTRCARRRTRRATGASLSGRLLERVEHAAGAARLHKWATTKDRRLTIGCGDADERL